MAERGQGPMNRNNDQERQKRLVALALGDMLGWTQRTLAFFDLAALAGFTMGLWLLFGLWRARRDRKD